MERVHQFVVIMFAKEVKHAPPVRMIVVFARPIAVMEFAHGQNHAHPVLMTVEIALTSAVMEDALFLKHAHPALVTAVTAQPAVMGSAHSPKHVQVARRIVAYVLIPAVMAFVEQLRIAVVAGMIVECVIFVVMVYAG